MKTLTSKIRNFLFVFLTLFTISNDASSYFPVIINSNEIESRFTTKKTDNQYKLSLTLSSLNAPYPNFIFEENNWDTIIQAGIHRLDKNHPLYPNAILKTGLEFIKRFNNIKVNYGVFEQFQKLKISVNTDYSLSYYLDEFIYKHSKSTPQKKHSLIINLNQNYKNTLYSVTAYQFRTEERQKKTPNYGYAYKFNASIPTHIYKQKIHLNFFNYFQSWNKDYKYNMSNKFIYHSNYYRNISQNYIKKTINTLGLNLNTEFDINTIKNNIFIEKYINENLEYYTLTSKFDLKKTVGFDTKLMTSIGLENPGNMIELGVSIQVQEEIKL